MIELRPYQVTAVERLEAAWAAGKRAPILVAPTGSGKTVIAVEIIRRALDRHERILFLAPRRELVEQTVDKLETAGVAHGVLMSGDPRHNDLARVTVASIDTLRARSARMGQSAVLRPDVVIVDEAHLFVTSKRAALLAEWPEARIVGLTATPARMDGLALGSIFDCLIDVATVAELTCAGYLVPARYFSLAEPDLARVRTTAGEYNLGDLADVMDRPQLVGDIVQTWLARAGGRRTVVFAVNIGHSVNLANQFQACAVAAEHVDAGTPTAERKAIFARFRSGETQVLTNCTLASYGFDLPDLDCIVIARPTKSLVLFLQMVGRGLRPAPGKEHCLVLDHAGVVHRFGFADEPRSWSLAGRVMNPREELKRRGQLVPEPMKLRDCPDCKAIFSGRECPSCGWYNKPKGMQLETLAGELIELNGTACEAESERLGFYRELLGYCERYRKKRGFAAYTYRDKFGDFPPRAWANHRPIECGLEVRRYAQSRGIAFARGRSAGAA